MQVPIPTQKAPQFCVDVLLPNQEVAKKTLDDYKGKYLCIIFYPADFSYVCPQELIEFSNKAKEFSDNNCELLIGSCDSIENHQQWSKLKRSEGGIQGMQIPLFADSTHKFARDYGCLLENSGISLRAVYIISDKGIVRHVLLNDLSVSRSVDETLRVVQAFQYSDRTGDGIPCKWKPQEKEDTIKIAPQEYKKYFEKHY